MIAADDETAELLRAALAERADRIRFDAPAQPIAVRRSSMRWVSSALVAAMVLVFIGLSVLWIGDDESGSDVVTRRQLTNRTYPIRVSTLKSSSVALRQRVVCSTMTSPLPACPRRGQRFRSGASSEPTY